MFFAPGTPQSVVDAGLRQWNAMNAPQPKNNASLMKVGGAAGGGGGGMKLMPGWNKPQQSPFGGAPQTGGGFPAVGGGFGGGMGGGSPFGGGGMGMGGGFGAPPGAAGGGMGMAWGQPGSGGSVYREPDRSFGGGPQLPPPGFQATYGSPFGGQFASPQTGQTDAFIQRLNDTQRPYQMGQATGRPNYDINALWNQAGGMAQNGWQNPFAPPSNPPIIRSTDGPGNNWPAPPVRTPAPQVSPGPMPPAPAQPTAGFPTGGPKPPATASAPSSSNPPIIRSTDGPGNNWPAPPAPPPAMPRPAATPSQPPRPAPPPAPAPQRQAPPAQNQMMYAGGSPNFDERTGTRIQQPAAMSAAQPIQPPSQGTPYGARAAQLPDVPSRLTMAGPIPNATPTGPRVQGGLQATSPRPATQPAAGPARPVGLAPAPPAAPPRRAFTPFDGSEEFEDLRARFPGVDARELARAYERDQNARQERARYDFDARYGDEAAQRTAWQMQAQERYAAEQRARKQADAEAEYRNKFIAPPSGTIYASPESLAQQQMYQRQQAILRDQQNAERNAAMYRRR